MIGPQAAFDTTPRGPFPAEGSSRGSKIADR